MIARHDRWLYRLLAAVWISALLVGCETFGKLPGNECSLKRGSCGLPAAEGPVVPFNPDASPYALITDLNELLAAANDDKKALVARLTYSEAQILEKEEALSSAKLEVEQSLGEVIKAREDFQQLQREILALRTRLRAAEKENKDVLESVIRLLDQMLERQPNEPTTKPAPGSSPSDR